MTGAKKPSARRLPVAKLMLSYMVVIMAMSGIFSGVFYVTSANVLDKRPDVTQFGYQFRDPDHEIAEWIGQRSDHGKANLAMHLIEINIVTLLLGGILSYWLARWTLRPIERALEEQDRFIADASHELRTPVTTALLSNEIALRNPHLSAGDARAVIATNVADLQELKRLSDELLDASAEQHRDGSRAQVQLRDLTHSVKEQLEPVAAQHHISIENEVPDKTVAIDVDRTRKVLLILLDNAIKYSPEHSSVRLTAKITKSAIYLTVSDNGIGIAKEDMKTIFDRFYRSDQARHQSSGHGLGLSIAQRLATEMHATIRIRSEVSQGSDFTIRIPVMIKT